MKAIELKFILKLLGFEGYRAPISKIDLNKGTRAEARNTICRELADRGIVAYSREVKQFKIEPAGKALGGGLNLWKWEKLKGSIVRSQ